ncbi:MAG TPA: sigma-54 dependent transcriptional regulator, partial [Anaeromyxobacter sp.]
MARILVADDHDALREGMVLSLTRLGHEVQGVRGGAEAIAAYRKRPADVVVTDLRMVPVDGIEVVRRLREADPEATVLVVSAHGTIPIAVEAMREGAIDFIEKPFSPEVLRARVQKAVEIARERRGARTARARAEALEEDLGRAHDPHGLVGSSEPMRRVHEQIRKVAPTDATVLVLGESGTGKELVARAVHDGSPRKEKPFVSVSCAAIPEGLLESELFGHEKGAFTGAIRRKLGRFELAHEGTLFLDEVGEIPPSIQVKLLRVLQERKFERVGGEETVEVDVRVVSATNRDLAALVKAGRFREDLYYRLDVVPIALPPLRERPGDVEELARYFLGRTAPRLGRAVNGFAPEALELLRRHRWPGNVRELENVIEQAL